MIDYLKGKIVNKETNNIVIETNNIGYYIYVSKNANFEVGQNTTVFTYTIYKDDGSYLMGFSSEEERKAFKMLISVQGIGPKTALTILGNTTPELLINAIQTQNYMYLKYIPGVGPKNASQIILDLNGNISNATCNNVYYEEIQSTLKAMGFKATSINKVLGQINLPNASKEEIIRAALAKLK